MCLRHLLVSRNIIESAILTEMCSCLLEVERDIGVYTLFSDIEHPIIVADTGIIARLTADCYLLTPLSIPVNRGNGVSQRGKQSMEVYRTKQRLTYNLLMSYRQFKKYRQTLICTFLVLHRAANGDVFVTISPILWQTLSNTFWSLRNHEEMQVISSFYH